MLEAAHPVDSRERNDFQRSVSSDPVIHQGLLRKFLLPSQNNANIWGLSLKDRPSSEHVSILL